MPSDRSYDHYLSAEPAEALLLGVLGTDATSTADRYERATALLLEYGQRDEQAYLHADPMDEPDTPQPFGLQLLADHHGDVLAVLADDRLTHEMRRHLGYEPKEVFLNDEDGQRWEWSDPTAAHTDSDHQIDQAVSTLRRRVQAAVGAAKDLVQADSNQVLNAITDRWQRTAADLSRDPWRTDPADRTHDVTEVRPPTLQ